MAVPQPAQTMQLAETLQQRIERDPEHNATKPETAPGNANGFLLQELVQPKEPLPLFQLEP